MAESRHSSQNPDINPENPGATPGAGATSGEGAYGEDYTAGERRGTPGGSGTWRAEEYASSAPSSTVPHLLRQLFDDVSVVVRKEVALASSEITHALDDAKQGAVGLVSGSAVLYAGLLFLLAAATLGLAEVMPDWAAALTVGAVVAVVGLIMVQTGKRKVRTSNFTPHRARDALRKDREMIERQRNEYR